MRYLFGFLETEKPKDLVYCLDYKHMNEFPKKEDSRCKLPDSYDLPCPITGYRNHTIHYVWLRILTVDVKIIKRKIMILEIFKRIWKFIKGIFVQEIEEVIVDTEIVKPTEVSCYTCKHQAKSWANGHSRNCLFKVIGRVKVFPEAQEYMNVYEECDIKNKDHNCEDHESV